MARPEPSEYALHYGNYIRLVEEEDIVGAMRSELARTLELLGDVPEEESLIRHPPYTWSVREVVGHLIDSERVFGYRALRFRAATRPRCRDSTRTPMPPPARSTAAHSPACGTSSTSSGGLTSASSPACRKKRGIAAGRPTTPRSPSAPWRTSSSATSGTTSPSSGKGSGEIDPTRGRGVSEVWEPGPSPSTSRPTRMTGSSSGASKRMPISTNLGSGSCSSTRRPATAGGPTGTGKPGRKVRSPRSARRSRPRRSRLACGRSRAIPSPCSIAGTPPAIASACRTASGPSRSRTCGTA